MTRTGARMSVKGGYILLAVLWLCASAAALSAILLAGAHRAVALSRNRIALTRAAWEVEGCLATALDASSRAGRENADAWRDLPATLGIVTIPCAIGAYPAGSRVNINTVSAENLTRMLRAAGLSDAAADSARDAFFDWVDADNEPRPMGAESEWYTSRGRREPRNRPIANLRELRHIRHMEMLGLDTLFDVDAAPLVISHAPFAALLSLPDISDETANAIRGIQIRNSGAVGRAELWDDAPAPVRAFLIDLLTRSGTISLDPIEWVVTFHSHSNGSGNQAALQVRLIRADGAIIVRDRRRWIP